MGLQNIINMIISEVFANDPRIDSEPLEEKEFNTLSEVEADLMKKTKDIKLIDPDL